MKNKQKIDPQEIQDKNVSVSGNAWTAEVANIFTASKAKKVCSTKHGTIITCEILHGFVTNDSAGITVTAFGTTLITDSICRIEKDYHPVSQAGAGELVGLCLKNSRLRTIRRSLSKIK